MSFVSIWIDIVALGIYFLQRQDSGLYFAGFLAQIMLVLALVVMIFKYSGKKYAETKLADRKIFSAGYITVIISTLLNIVVLILYGLNYFGLNSLIFPA